MKTWFKVSDFNISGKDIPEDVADKIYLYHIIPLNEVRNAIEIPVWPSEKSGYRPKWWEKKQGRSGTSQHVFMGKGATDVTCQDFKENKGVLLEALIKCTEYKRIALYANFYHCDHAGIEERFFINTSSGWKYICGLDDPKINEYL